VDALNAYTAGLPPVQAILLSTDLWEQMRRQAADLAPEEACGLLGGVIEAGVYHARRAWPVENSLHSPTRYRLAPRQQLAAFEAMEAAGLELVAIYHSHPCGPDAPSPSDVAEAWYPETVYLIWSAQGGAWQCRAFTIRSQTVRATRLRVV